MRQNRTPNEIAGIICEMRLDDENRWPSSDTSKNNVNLMKRKAEIQHNLDMGRIDYLNADLELAKGRSEFGVGEVFKVENCGYMEILKVASVHKIKVRFFNTGNVAITSIKEIKSGNLFDRMAKTIYDIGYLGRKSTCSADKRENAYRHWRSMFYRCYSGVYRNYPRCIIEKEWHCFAHFLLWFNQTYPHRSKVGMTLIRSNYHIYSANTCSWGIADEYEQGKQKNTKKIIKRIKK